MKTLLVITAIFILFRPAMPLVDYAVNYRYFSKVLCVNKAKPKMHCNGKCCLMKELAKAAEKETPAVPSKKSQSSPEILFCQAVKSFEFIKLPIDLKLPANSYLNLYRFSESGSLFQPPDLV